MLVGVTGSRGKLGRATVGELRRAGLKVREIERIPADGVIGADLRLAEEAARALAGCDMVVHLAAWPTPHSAPAGEVFADNVAMASNVLHAAVSQGTRRVVVASSQSVLGLAWSDKVREPEYLPVDEAHPCRPGDSYSLSKLVTEQLAQLLAQRGEIDATVLRFPVIWDPEQFASEVAGRLGRPQQGAKSQWAFVDVRDAARAVRLALAAGKPGYRLFNIAAPHVFAPVSTAELVNEWYPALAASAQAPSGQDACFDWRAARDGLGFVCRYRWTHDGIVDSGAV